MIQDLQRFALRMKSFARTALKKARPIWNRTLFGRRAGMAVQRVVRSVR
jgi:hypothetical protein